MAWFCTDYCRFWEVRKDATAVHGWCLKYKRYVMYTDICGCAPKERVGNKPNGKKPVDPQLKYKEAIKGISSLGVEYER